MLKQLTITDFQAHEQFTLKLDKRITSILGRTDSGKSSTFRAFRWVTLNKPSGDQFIRHGTKQAETRLTFEDHEVVRIKGKGVNSYHLDGEEYKAFGNDVPKAIASALNISEDSFQRQIDAPLWFCDTPGQVSKALNVIVNLDLMDRTMANVAVELRRCKASIEASEERLARAEQSKNALEWVVDADLSLKRLEAQERDLVALQAKRDALEGILARIKEAEREASIEIPDLSELDQTKERIERLKGRFRDLSNMVKEIKRLEAERCELEQNLTAVERSLKEATKGRCPVCGNDLKSS